MATAIIAIVGSLLGVVLGSALSSLAQNSLAKKTRGWKLEDVKRESYADFLRSISTSYAKAKAGQGAGEADRDRRALIGLFKDDLGISRGEEDDHAAGQTGADVRA